ncbi:MAG TPA: DUF481 domain-containing protein [Humisphaera sp.]|jgi:putative salt-induced outer membrane protein YdiY|nr:DUF481 domain-containing protein [Humisphaera sp.]
MNNFALRALTAFAVCLSLTGSALADQIVFKNGDRLTGKIVSMDGGKLVVKSAVAGAVTVDLKDVSTFSTDGPIEIHLNDGTVLKQPVAVDKEGTISAGGADMKPETISLGAVKSINPPNGTWTGSVTVGGSFARGNTDSDSINASAHVVRRGENDRITADAGYFWSREHVPGVSGKHETENNWFISPKYDYFFQPKLYGYANARIERDLIAKLSLLFSPGVGVGYQWVEKPDFHFNTEGGLSWLYRDFSNDGTTESAALRLAYHIDKKLNDKVTVFHDLEYLPGLDSINNYFFDTDAGIRTTLTEKMFAEIKLDFKYNSIPAPGQQNSDTRFLVGVGWNF